MWSSSSKAARVGPRFLVLALVSWAAASACTDEGDGRGIRGGPLTTDAGDSDSNPSAGCGGGAGTTGLVSRKSVAVGGVTRTYDLFVPPTYDGTHSLPLVVVLHGDGGSGAGIRGSFALEALAAGHAIFAYPDGLEQTWNIDSADALRRDVAFIDALTADLASSYCTDQKRVFAVGFSKGAYFANMLACLTKTGLRAVVTHAGGGPFGVDGSGTSFDADGNLVCPAPPVAALQVQGDNDGTVPLDEGQKARDHWRRVNGCQPTSTAYTPSPCVAYDGCAEGRPEVWCEIPGMDHAIWPQNGAQVTWAFLAKQ